MRGQFRITRCMETREYFSEHLGTTPSTLSISLSTWIMLLINYLFSGGCGIVPSPHGFVITYADAIKRPSSCMLYPRRTGSFPSWPCGGTNPECGSLAQ